LPLRILCPHCRRLCQLEEAPNATVLACPLCGGSFGLRRHPDAVLSSQLVEPMTVPLAAEAPAAEGANGPAPVAGPMDLAPPRRGRGEEPMRELSLEGGPPLAWIDRVLPSRPLPFLLVVFGLSAGCWLLGYWLADDRQKFIDPRQCREWYAQLLYLPAHFIALRLFVTLYTRNFMAGVSHLDMPLNRAWEWMRWVIGPVGLFSLVLAAPLCARDYFELDGDKYRDSLVGPVVREGVKGTPDVDVFFGWPEDARPDLPAEEVCKAGHLQETVHAVGTADRLMWGIWCVEWIVNAYIWVLLLGFLFLTMRILRTHTFRDPVEVVLHEKQYRPFLLMSGQGASIVLGFAVVNCLYVSYAQGTITDYIGIGVTIALLIMGFCPPWLQIKSSVEKVVSSEIFRLREGLIAEHRHQAVLARQGVPAALDLNTRVNEALVILRIDYLDRLSAQIGRNEGMAMLLKLLAPLATVGWQLVRGVVGFP
jgi:hypothetical protein